MSTPEVRITVNGRQALTYNLAAERHGMEPDAVRMALKRAELEPCGKLERLPLFYATAVRAVLRQRPGRGAPGVPRPHRAGEDVLTQGAIKVPAKRGKMAERLRDKAAQ
jgi:hypothetical protein